MKVRITTDVSEFIAHNGPKLSYTRKQLGNELFIKSQDLLFEQGINDVEVNMSSWDGVPIFFQNNPKGSIPFDIFAASFYLLSRYEEYLPYVQDKFERFPAGESLAFQQGFLEKPLIDIWAIKFLDIIKESFEDLSYSEREFKKISTIDVSNVYAYKHKGFLRNFGGILADIFTLRFDIVVERVLVLLRLRKDPNDTFEEILKISKKGYETIFFFLIGDYTTYDNNVSSSNNVYRSLIKSVGDYVAVGLMPSYFTMKISEKLKKEKRRMEEILNQPVVRSRQHCLRLKLPETYQNLLDLEIMEDYSMGYETQYGFRASTCTPFYFYDLDFEIQTPLRIIPFAFMDVTFNEHLNLIPAIAESKILQLVGEVQKVKGTFVSFFHNEALSENVQWKDWKTIYQNLFMDK